MIIPDPDAKSFGADRIWIRYTGVNGW